VKYLVVLILWILFVLAQVGGFLLGALAAFFGQFDYANRIVRAQDKATAAFLGFSGDSTVSSECEKSDCRLCKILCAILNYVLEPDHCKKNDPA
jgi:hypothetical protein